MSRKLKAPSTRRSVTKVSKRARNLERRFIEAPVLPVWIWNDISGAITVTRVSGGDSDPDIDVDIAQMMSIGGEDIGGSTVLGLNVVQLLLKIGAGGAGSGVSGYAINGLPLGFETDYYMAGTGVFHQAAGSSPIYRCSARSQIGLSELLLIWDGASTGNPLGPASSSAGGPFDFAAGDVLFDGQIILP